MLGDAAGLTGCIECVLAAGVTAPVQARGIFASHPWRTCVRAAARDPNHRGWRVARSGYQQEATLCYEVAR